MTQGAGTAVTLTVSSDRGEAIYNGPWNDGAFGRNINYTFASAGARTLSVVARTGASETRASLVVNVVNTAPTLTLQASGNPSQGEAYPVAALITDINEPDPSVLCAKTVWSVDAPDTLSGTTGCTQKVTFGTTGSRQVRVTTQDSEGVGAARTLTLDVQPPPVNPYPRIVSSGVYARDFHRSGVVTGCYDTPVTSGNTIDLRDLGCTLLVNQPQPRRYSGGVSVENPSNEALTYDWRLYVTDNRGEVLLYSTIGSASPTFPLYPYANAVDVTTPCRVTLRVNAPDPSRSKSLTVWTGNCTYYSTRLN